MTPGIARSGGLVFNKLTQEAKKYGPKGYIGGGAFFTVMGVVIGIHAALDPTRVSLRGAPFWVLSVLMFLVGLILLLAGLRARRDRTK